MAESELTADLAEQMRGFTVEPHTIQPRSTILVDLTGNEDELLARMKQKTRYNIRLAEKKGVVVRETNDIQGFYQLMQTTGTRDGFAVHDISYYQKAYDIFSPSGACVLLGAFHEEKPLAYLMLFLSGERSWYFYGASDDASRNLMPTYLLQWAAMRWSKAHGATIYDLWGIPDASAEELEEQFMQRSDGLWGVYRFKRGFGGEVVRSAPAFIRVYQRFCIAPTRKFGLEEWQTQYDQAGRRPNSAMEPAFAAVPRRAYPANVAMGGSQETKRLEPHVLSGRQRSSGS